MEKQLKMILEQIGRAGAMIPKALSQTVQEFGETRQVS